MRVGSLLGLESVVDNIINNFMRKIVLLRADMFSVEIQEQVQKFLDIDYIVLRADILNPVMVIEV